MKKSLSPKGVIIIISAVAVIILFFMGNRGLFNFVKNTNYFFSSLFDRSFNYQQFDSLKRENQTLKQEIKNLKEGILSNQNISTQKALVFYSYPFSGKESIIVNTGTIDGIEINMPVTVDGFLLGKVIKVSDNQAEVQTIFDPNWKSGVGVDNYQNKAVLIGGNNPIIDLIPNDALVDNGDEVFNLAPEYTIYQSLGTISKIESNSGNVWEFGSLVVPYNITDIREVEIVTNFP